MSMNTGPTRRLIAAQPATMIEAQPTTVEEQIAESLSPALNAGFRARERNSINTGHLALRHALEFRKDDRLLIRDRQPLDLAQETIRKCIEIQADIVRFGLGKPDR